MKEIFHKQNWVVILRQVYPASLLDVFTGNCQRVWWINQELLTLGWGLTVDQKWSQ
jgi:hypothetical protein